MSDGKKDQIQSPELRRYVDKTIKQTVSNEFKNLKEFESKNPRLKPVLTKEIVNDRLSNVHNIESFGRTLIDQILKGNLKELEKAGELEKISFDTNIEVKPKFSDNNDGTTCVTVCIGGGPIPAQVCIEICG